jgi:hypothetical protein
MDWGWEVEALAAGQGTPALGWLEDTLIYCHTGYTLAPNWIHLISKTKKAGYTFVPLKIIVASFI